MLNKWRQKFNRMSKDEMIQLEQSCANILNFMEFDEDFQHPPEFAAVDFLLYNINEHWLMRGEE